MRSQCSIGLSIASWCSLTTKCLSDRIFFRIGKTTMSNQVSLQKKRVVVTGAAGFIGSNLVDKLVEHDCSIVGIDNLSTGIIERGNSSRFNQGTSYEFHQADITNVDQMCELFQDTDTVFHLAALARVSYSIDHPLQANEANVTGTLSVLEAARKVGVRRVVFSCSSSIFGGVENFPTPETSRPQPLSPYALHKVVGAEYCRLYSELHGMDTISLLYYNVFGPHQRADSAYATVIPAFFAAAMLNQECRIDGDGEQSRDFCFVSNVVDALILAAQSNQKFAGDLVNVACGEHNTVNEAYEAICKIVGRPVKKNHAPPRLGDPRKSHADISKAHQLLGYKPSIMFAEGMKITGQWWLDNQPTSWKFKKEGTFND